MGSAWREGCRARCPSWGWHLGQVRARARCPLGATTVSSRRAITLDNTLVILSTVAPDAGRYYVQAVNDKNGDNKTSQPITLTVASECGGHSPPIPSLAPKFNLQ